MILERELIFVLNCSLEPEVKETTKKEMTVLDVGGRPQRNILGKTHTIKQGLTTQSTQCPRQELNRSPRGGRQGKDHCANLTAPHIAHQPNLFIHFDQFCLC